jgi:hypothetical protein
MRRNKLVKKLHDAWWELDTATQLALPDGYHLMWPFMYDIMDAAREQLRRENRAKRWSGRQ